MVSLLFSVAWGWRVSPKELNTASAVGPKSICVVFYKIFYINQFIHTLTKSLLFDQPLDPNIFNFFAKNVLSTETFSSHLSHTFSYCSCLRLSHPNIFNFFEKYLISTNLSFFKTSSEFSLQKSARSCCSCLLLSQLPPNLVPCEIRF